MEIVIATNNINKFREIKKLFKNTNISFLFLWDFKKNIKITENCKTIKGNSIKKAKETAKILNKVCLADDSGLEVDFLNGSPGVISARFAGKGCSYKDNNLKLFGLLKDVPVNKRKARFRCVFSLADKNGLIKTTEGICKGIITFKEIGKNGFGYDPIFMPNGFKKTFAQMSLKQKNKISHRAIAANKMKEFLKKYPK